ncbi:MAG: hypothetical protein Q4C98_03580 [Capnocytophaga sp.]|nr:hypothetical protein [Capnocytophaga sp.]
MKKYFYIWIAFFPFLGWGQNADVYVVIPQRYDFQKGNNDYQLSELTKFLLEKQNFKVFYEDNIPTEIHSNPCNALKANVLNSSGIFVTKLQLVLTDCSGKQVFASEIGTSREKEFKKAYQMALRNTVDTSNKLSDFKKNYKPVISSSDSQMSEKQTVTPVHNTAVAPISDSSVLYAQAKELGFQVVDNTPKVILKLSNTSLPNVFIAEDDQNNHGILYKKGENYIFEFVQDGKLQHKILNIKF